MAETTLRVEGIDNQEKLEKVEGALSHFPGVERALFDVEKGEAHIEFNDAVTNMNQMKDLLESLK